MTATQDLFAALRKKGFQTARVKNLLPEWWTPEFEATPSGGQQVKLYIARALSLQLKPFSEHPPRVEFDLPDRRYFKRSAKTSESDLVAAVAVARSASRIALAACDADFVPPAPTGAAIRKHILKSGAPWIGLKELIAYAWGCGIPVLHLATPLLGKKKMDGIAMSLNGRPSIVLSNNRKNGFLLFHLAHELGHIALGHLGQNDAIVDDEIKNEGDLDKDFQEQQADKFAIELLTGNAESSFILKRKIKALHLAGLATDKGRETKIDPSHVLLSCAHRDPSIYPLCVAALKQLAAGHSDQDLVTNMALHHLAEGLRADSEHLLRNLIV